MVLRAAVEPMLISAMITRTESEKRMLFIGTGVPITAIWAGVSSEWVDVGLNSVPYGTKARMVGLGRGLVPRPGGKRRRGR
jgi:hypothetical protein